MKKEKLSKKNSHTHCKGLNKKQKERERKSEKIPCKKLTEFSRKKKKKKRTFLKSHK